MQNNKKKSKQTFKIILIILIVLIIAIAVVVSIAIINNKNTNTTDNNSTNILEGTFIYNENVKYEFNSNSKGAMYDNETKYQYTYSIEENTLKMDFENEAVHDATYTFNIENDTLTLIGGEGTMGGEYILKKESK